MDPRPANLTWARWSDNHIHINAFPSFFRIKFHFLPCCLFLAFVRVQWGLVGRPKSMPGNRYFLIKMDRWFETENAKSKASRVSASIQLDNRSRKVKPNWLHIFNI